MSDDLYSKLFYLRHQTGDKLYPKRIKNNDTGVRAFGVSRGGNTKMDSIEVRDEAEMRKYVLERGYAVRAATLNSTRQGLYKVGMKAIIEVVEGG